MDNYRKKVLDSLEVYTRSNTSNVLAHFQIVTSRPLLSCPAPTGHLASTANVVEAIFLSCPTK